VSTTARAQRPQAPSHSIRNQHNFRTDPSRMGCIVSSPRAAALADDADVVATIAAYARSPSGSLAGLPLSLVACRVCRGANEAAFETLHCDGLVLHPIVFVSGQHNTTEFAQYHSKLHTPPHV
jgi:hypothetical protein